MRIHFLEILRNGPQLSPSVLDQASVPPFESGNLTLSAGETASKPNLPPQESNKEQLEEHWVLYSLSIVDESAVASHFE